MMSPYALIPFGISFVSGIWLFVSKGRILDLLNDEELSRFGGPLMMNRRLDNYLLRRESVPGTRLARRLRAYRLSLAVFICAWLVFGGFVFAGMHR